MRLRESKRERTSLGELVCLLLADALYGHQDLPGRVGDCLDRVETSFLELGDVARRNAASLVG